MGKFGAGADAGDVRVLIENGEYWLRNRGDIAMMAVTVRRLRAQWPSARIGMLTEQPRVLRALLPDAEPIDVAAGGRWEQDPRGQWEHAPRGRWEHAPRPHRLGDEAALRWRAATDGPKSRVRAFRKALRGNAEPSDPPAPPLPEAVSRADLVLAQGGGYLTDVDRYQAGRALDLLEHAQSLGIPTAMIGQGLGPLDDPRLLERAARVLPGVGLIALREGRCGPKLLADLGVAPERIVVTGDDAVELAYGLRRAEIGGDLGVCLRITYYARVGAAAQDILGEVIRSRAAEFDAALRPLIISEYEAEDRDCTRRLLAGAVRTRRPVGRAGTAEDVARQVSRCRVVVTSAYHLAVFALSQGIPAVGITASRYYDDKFHGLAAMFGNGLRVVDVRDPHLGPTLSTAVRELWESAPELRDPLQHRAVEQIDASRAGMRRAFGLVDGERKPIPAREER
ncbi:polysaccharide pyruvyl transferase family protein [Nocardia sp. BMG51109]|uniref:polysaccharide pyruvyl transferase family protein n=1 Tax=Nocardia sp. BMG51109 TaxID=1056816 RepID=UPI0004667D3D|nr:polysaccharide pyruvyl transferase family protein [Nocardia sp. BMG51109]